MRRSRRCRVAPSSVVMRERTPFPRKVIEALPDLKLLITTGTRNNSFDVKAAAERGIPVCGTGGFGNPTARIAFGLMLELARQIGFENARMKSGAPWQIDAGPSICKARRSASSGSASSAQRVATIAKALGMKVIAWSQNLTPEKAKEAGDAGRPRTNCSAIRFRHHPCRAQRPHARARRRARTRR